MIADDEFGSVAIADYLYMKGHRTVLYRSCPGESDSASRRQSSFEARATQLGMRTIAGKTADWKGRLSEGEEELLGQRMQLGITAAVCWGDPSAYALLSHCKHHQIRVPEDFAVVGFNGIEAPVEPVQILTTVRAGWSNVAQRAVHVLVDRLEGREVPSLTKLPVEFFPGETA